MPVHVSENNRPVRLLPYVLASACLFGVCLEGFAQAPPKNAEDEYQREQAKLVQQLKRLNTSLVTPEIFEEFRAIDRDYRNILRQGTNGRNPKEMAALRAGLRYRVLTLSDPDIQAEASKFAASNKNLQRDLAGAGPALAIPNAQTRAKFRELVCAETMPLLKQLLNEGNLLARSAALQRMLDLEVVPARGQLRMQMFDEVDEAFLAVLNDPKQPDALKALAANAIKIYLQKADAETQIEVAFATALAKEVERPYLSDGYLVNLLLAMEEVREPRQVVGVKVPIVHCAMSKLITNRALDIQVRCRAARVMGRAGWDKQIDYDVLAWAIADLTLETGFLFKNAADRKDRKWAYCGWNLYTAFHHENSREVDGSPPALPKGFLNRAPKSEVVRNAYMNAVPVMAHLMYSDKPVGDRELRPLFGWVNGNKPADLKFDPVCPPIKQPAPAGAAPPANNGGG